MDNEESDWESEENYTDSRDDDDDDEDNEDPVLEKYSQVMNC